MPTYQYRCKQCGHELEEFQQITEEPLVHCPNCDTDNLLRIMGTSGAVIFKGSGFYHTDYKRGKSKKDSSSKEDEKKTTKPESGTKPADSSDKK